MTTAVQDKNKTVITISRRIPKKELERIIRYIDLPVIKPRKGVTKKMIQELADEMTAGMAERFNKERSNP
jgi:hypothetical protein